MAGLSEVQALFWRAITHPTGVADFLATADRASVALFHEVFAGSPELGNVARVDIYANSYYWRLHQVLAEQFPVTAWLLGAERLQNLATDYVLVCPSRAPDLGRFGAGFPAFIAGHALGRELAGLHEVAAVEWSIVDAIDRPDEPVLGVAELARVPASEWPALRLRAAATTTLVGSRVGFSALARACHEGAPPVAVHGAGECTLVWRAGLVVRHRDVAAEEAAALAVALAGGSFAEVCAAIDGEVERAAGQAAGWLRAWVEAGLFAAAPCGEITA